MQAVAATLKGLPAARRRSWKARRTGLCLIPTGTAMYSAARTRARPPQTIRLPRRVPPSRFSGATPTSAAIWWRDSWPSSGRFASRVRAVTRHAAQPIRLGLVERARRDGVLQVPLDVGEPLLDPADVLRDVALDGAAREAQPILVGGEHLDQRPAAGQQTLQELRGVIREGARRRPDALGKGGQYPGIEGVGLGELAHRPGEVAPLARIDDSHRQASPRQRDGGQRLETAGGFKHHQRRGQRDEARGELGEPMVVVGDNPMLAVRQRGDVEHGLRDIDAMKQSMTSSKREATGVARPCVMRGGSPGNCSGSRRSTTGGTQANERARGP